MHIIIKKKNTSLYQCFVYILFWALMTEWSWETSGRQLFSEYLRDLSGNENLGNFCMGGQIWVPVSWGSGWSGKTVEICFRYLWDPLVWYSATIGISHVTPKQSNISRNCVYVETTQGQNSFAVCWLELSIISPGSRTSKRDHVFPLR